MGRFIRFAKMTFFIAGCLSAVMIFSAFKKSPEVQKTIGEELHKKVLAGIESGKMKWAETFQGEEENGLEAAREHTQEFIENVQEQKERDHEANEQRKNSYIYHHNGKQWVFIQGKYYEYNPKNIYMVGGVKTFYQPPASTQGPVDVKKSQSEVVSQKFVRHASAAPDKASNQDEILNLKQVYSKDGIKQLKQNLQQIKVNMKERNKALKALQQNQ